MRLACLPLYLRCLPESEERKESRKRGIKDTMMFFYPQLRQCLQTHGHMGMCSSILFFFRWESNTSVWLLLFILTHCFNRIHWLGRMHSSGKESPHYRRICGSGESITRAEAKKKKNLSSLFLYSHHFGVHAFHVWISTGGMEWDSTHHIYRYVRWHFQFKWIFTDAKPFSLAIDALKTSQI